MCVCVCVCVSHLTVVRVLLLRELLLQRALLPHLLGHRLFHLVQLLARRGPRQCAPATPVDPVIAVAQLMNVLSGALPDSFIGGVC